MTQGRATQTDRRPENPNLRWHVRKDFSRFMIAALSGCARPRPQASSVRVSLWEPISKVAKHLPRHHNASPTSVSRLPLAVPVLNRPESFCGIEHQPIEETL
jgi:hypothetical protein